jgi:uncharacterized protein
MSCFPDVNVWLALASRRHAHSISATEWMSTVEEPVLFCRVTQMGLLRLLSNPAVMGAEVQSPEQAWRVYRKILFDERISFQQESPHLERVWQRPATGKGWTDSYLRAFAEAAGATLVTFDRRLARECAQAKLLS